MNRSAFIRGFLDELAKTAMGVSPAPLPGTVGSGSIFGGGGPGSGGRLGALPLLGGGRARRAPSLTGMSPNPAPMGFTPQS